MHFADDGASDYIARRKFLGFGVALHEAFEKNIAEDAAFSAESFGEQEARRTLDGESSGMELHEFHIRENGAGFIGDGHAIASGNFGIGGFAIDLTEAAGGEKNSESADLVKRAVVFIDEPDASGAAVFKNQAGGERVGAKMEVRDFVSAGKEGATDFAASRIAMRVEDARAAVRGFTRESEFGAGTIEFGAPLDELGDVLRAFFDQESDGFGAAEAVACAEGVLFVQPNFIFVAERDGDAALRPGGGGVAESGFGEDEDAARAAEFNGGAQTCDA